MTLWRLVCAFVRFYPAYTLKKVLWELTMPQLLGMAGELLPLRKEESLIALTISRDPYTKEDAQKRLWQSFQDRSLAKPMKDVTETDHFEDYKRVQAVLDARKKNGA